MIDLGIIITGIIGFLSSILSAWLGWFFSRKKYNSEVDNNLISNMKESLDFYKRLSDDNKDRLEEILKRNDELEERDKKLEEEVRDLRKQVFRLMSTMCMDLQCKVRQKEAISKLFGNENDSQEVI